MAKQKEKSSLILVREKESIKEAFQLKAKYQKSDMSKKIKSWIKKYLNGELD